MSIDPKVLNRLQSEEVFLQSFSRAPRRVKINRGQTWTVRFLPARFGSDGIWYARIARHWLVKLPIICPRNTAEDFGGDPVFECPVCLACQELAESQDEALEQLAFKTRASVMFMTYCIVWEKDGVQQNLNEVLQPYEFWHYRGTFEELKGFYLAGGKKSKDSVLDYMTGNDFSVNRTVKGIRLDKLEPSPIFDPKNPKFKDYISKIESALKPPKITLPTKEQLVAFAQKLHTAADQLVAEDLPQRTTEVNTPPRTQAVKRPTRVLLDEEEDDVPFESSTKSPTAGTKETEKESGANVKSSPPSEDDEDENLPMQDIDMVPPETMTTEAEEELPAINEENESESALDMNDIVRRLRALKK